MKIQRRGFTLVELVVVATLVALLLAVLLPMAGRKRNADGLAQSLFNMARIIRAAQAYHFDHAGQVPLRGARYTSGTLSGWDTWNACGKNCDSLWQGSTGGIFDESAYARFLNPYFYTARIPQPPGYLNTGSGATWNFNDGTPTAAQRSLQIPGLKSPGDVATRQRLWPNPTAGVSCYDDVGTSYLSNMKWWDLVGLPSGFTQRFNEGTRRIGLAFGGANPNYVFMNDQTLDVVSNSAPGFQMMGEFAKPNASVVGLADGRAAYLLIVPGAMNGPGYTLSP